MVAQVANVDISVLINGESGTGKELVSKALHLGSKRASSELVIVNCGAIPEGIIESELFGHKKGAYTDAADSRKGYFETANKGTIFLDEIGEMPLSTQSRLLRILENGEFMKVGSSKVQKTNVRIVAATNVNMDSAIKKNKFREDLYYRLSTVEINIPPLRRRKNDIVLLFRKFASDFGKKYNMPTVRLDDEAQILLKNYRWNGNIRQLKNVTEQLSVLEQERAINASLLGSYLPNPVSNLPALIEENNDGSDFSSEREILYKILFDMKKDLNEVKKVINKIQNDDPDYKISDLNDISEKLNDNFDNQALVTINDKSEYQTQNDNFEYAEEIFEEETLSIQDKELELIIKSLERNNGKRKAAAKELGISERTLYRKIKQYDIKL
jgi:DNA-binding NtrC family response regulator